MGNLGKFEEIQFTANNIEASKDFYLKIGFEVVDIQRDKEGNPWMIQLKRENISIALIIKAYQKEVSLGFKSKNVPALKKDLLKTGVSLEHDGTSHPRSKTLSFRDPSGNLIFVFEDKE